MKSATERNNEISYHHTRSVILLIAFTSCGCRNLFDCILVWSNFWN